jgi:hypothetical protein
MPPTAPHQLRDGNVAAVGVQPQMKLTVASLFPMAGAPPAPAPAESAQGNLLPLPPPVVAATATPAALPQLPTAPEDTPARLFMQNAFALQVHDMARRLGT